MALKKTVEQNNIAYLPINMRQQLIALSHRYVCCLAGRCYQHCCLS